jgi:hypothetical protein
MARSAMRATTEKRQSRGITVSTQTRHPATMNTPLGSAPSTKGT